LLESEPGANMIFEECLEFDMAKAPLIFTYYIAAPVEKVWMVRFEEANQKIFMGADFELDLKPGGRCPGRGRAKMGSRCGM